MDIKKLDQPLTREHIDFRVAQLRKSGDVVWCSILAYKDARVDMQILDNVCGKFGWMSSYGRDTKGVLQCTIDIYDNEKGQWVSKTSNGTESFTEAEKGEYSDAFKRAGFMWGIGRALYDFPQIWVQLNESEYYEKDGKVKAASKLRPNSWIWEMSEDYSKVIAKQKIGGKVVTRFNSKPYDNK